MSAPGVEFSIQQIADDSQVNRGAVISETGLIAWYSFSQPDRGGAASDIYVYHDGVVQSVTKNTMNLLSADVNPFVHSNSVMWVTTLELTNPDDITWTMRKVAPTPGSPRELDANYAAHCEHDGEGGSLGRQWFDGPDTNTANSTSSLAGKGRHPSGRSEIVMWRQGSNEIKRITQDTRNDLAPSGWGKLLAWQKAKGWPFGWEIMVMDGDHRSQLTTNFYYDMGPHVHDHLVTWYGWDGQDFEIFAYDNRNNHTIQITSNQYDDVSPMSYNGVITWETYPAVEADVFLWKDGQTKKLSANIEDDVNPRIWKDQVVWQGFDGDDFEIYLFDGEKTVKLTDNLYDDINPDIADGIICWMGYHDNWDAEIFVQTDPGSKPIRLTDNEYEDRNPRTGAGLVVWQATDNDKSQIYLAEPRN